MRKYVDFITYIQFQKLRTLYLFPSKHLPLALNKDRNIDLDSVLKIRAQNWSYSESGIAFQRCQVELKTSSKSRP